MPKSRYLGLDLGGTKIACGAVQKGRVLWRVEEKTERDSPAGLLEQLQRIVEAALKREPRVAGLGMAAAGPIDFQRRVLVVPPNLPHAGTLEIVKPFQLLSQPVKLENDANCAALAEHLYGSGRGCRHFLYMTVSTGIGGGLIVNGELYRGSNGNAGEVGHIPLKPGGRRCGCGARGCLEAYCSGTALARQAVSRVRKHKESLLYGAYKEKTMDAKKIFKAAKEGDPLAGSLADEFIQRLSQGICALATSLNPERVVLGGGVIRSAASWLPTLEEEVRRHLMPPLRRLRIVRSKFVRDAALIGAASLFLTS